ncbi:hypothetical protein LH425_02800 [Laribacter hongkongensis]|uniref:hypothetical protein n=1 Tax=Laribacter hongkongensis TaxID=168471 RepID=UPI00283091E6|nr:hypothetical protein [Laribacter hongkongensis]
MERQPVRHTFIPIARSSCLLPRAWACASASRTRWSCRSTAYCSCRRSCTTISTATCRAPSGTRWRSTCTAWGRRSSIHRIWARSTLCTGTALPASCTAARWPSRCGRTSSGWKTPFPSSTCWVSCRSCTCCRSRTAGR